MREKNLMVLALLGVIIGASGLGIGVYSTMQVQTGAFKGEDGDDGDDGTNGQDAPGDIVVGILDPDDGEIVSGNISIRILVSGSDEYIISILRNSTEIGTSLTMIWNTTLVADGWWNITVIAFDTTSTKKSSDEVLVYVKNSISADPHVITQPMGKIIAVHNGSRDDEQIPWDPSYIASHDGETYIWSDYGPELMDDTYCDSGSHPHCYFNDADLDPFGMYIVVLQDRGSYQSIHVKWSGFGYLMNEVGGIIDTGMADIYATILYYSGEWFVYNMGGTVGTVNFWCHGP